MASRNPITVTKSTWTNLASEGLWTAGNKFIIQNPSGSVVLFHIGGSNPPQNERRASAWFPEREYVIDFDGELIWAKSSGADVMLRVRDA